MMIYPFSFILLFLIIYYMYKDRDIKKIYMKTVIVTALVEVFIEQGNFIELGNIAVSYASFMEIVMLILSIIIIIKRKTINRKVLILGFVLILIVFLGICNLIFNPAKLQAGTSNVTWDDVMRGAELEYIQYNPYVMKQAIQLGIFIISIAGIYTSFEKEDYFYVLNKFGKGIKLMLIIGVIEIIAKYGFNSNVYNEACIMIFGKSQQAYNEIVARGRLYVLQGFTKEASHYAYVLLLSMITLLGIHFHTKKEKKWIAIAFIIMLLSGSFSVFLFLGGFISILLVKWIQNSNTRQRIIKLGIVVIVITSTIIILITNMDNMYKNLKAEGFIQRRVKSLIQEIQLISNGEWLEQKEALEWSNRVRLGSTYETLKLVLARPILGHGIASVTSHGSTSMLLAGIGILGTTIWTALCFENAKLMNGKKGYYIIGIIIFFLINLLNSMWLRPFYELSVVIWMISLSVIFNETQNSHEISKDIQKIFQNNLKEEKK